MRMKKVPVNIQVLIFLRLIIEARGRRRVISTSKMRKITAIKKNRREKGRRADPLGSNPHSKGEFFSRSVIVFLAKIEEIIITAELIRRIRRVKKVAIRIIFPGSPDLLIGSQLYFIY